MEGEARMALSARLLDARRTPRALTEHGPDARLETLRSVAGMLILPPAVRAEVFLARQSPWG
ncbi:hypothetical protein CDV50_00710 [Haematobacter massiliensis]|nr:hypothetical protein CDV50_00710 [Haematobacter massiliensis]OWJ85237.1 hypothetical protein CDV51_12415 [Haematobacter massiliensis]